MSAARCECGRHAARCLFGRAHVWHIVGKGTWAWCTACGSTCPETPDADPGDIPPMVLAANAVRRARNAL